MKPKNHPENNDIPENFAPAWQQFNQLIEKTVLPFFQERCGQNLTLTTTIRGKQSGSFDIAFTAPDLLTEEELDARQYEVLPWTKTLKKIMPSIFEGDCIHRPILYAGLYREEPHLLSLSSITVDRAERRKGLGTTFEQALRAWAMAEGITHITGEHHNEEAAAFFVMQGWRLVQELTPDERLRYRMPQGILRTVAFLQPQEESIAVLPRWKNARPDERLELSRHTMALRQWLQLAQEFVHEASEQELQKIWPSVTLLNTQLPPHIQSDALADITSYNARFAVLKGLVHRLNLCEEECFGHATLHTLQQARDMLLHAMGEDAE